MSPCMPPSGVSFSRSVGSVVWPRTDTFPMRFHPLLRREECSEWKLDALGRGNIVALDVHSGGAENKEFWLLERF